jgi:hypothetical protein
MFASEDDRERYENVLQDALEDVMVVAVRRGLDPARLVAQFDVDLAPVPRLDHILTIAIRDSSISVECSGIAHEWLSIGTGYIDSRFSKCVTTLLTELENKALEAGQYI